MKTDYDYRWGSHLPILIKLVNQTKGDILELGMGLYSTPFLHWACFPDRTLVSYESDFDCWFKNVGYENKTHLVQLARNWDNIFIDRDWDIALVDHSPSQRRIVEIKRLANFAKYIVIHDTQRNSRFCDLNQIWPLFKYRYDYTKAVPHTTVVSNFVDLSFLVDKEY
jgi:hypothetical protein